MDKDKNKIRVGVIGGGAAGMTAAISAAKMGADVTILEGGERVGKKILSTGNGKCNLGNLDLGAEDYQGADRKWIAECLAEFGVQDTIRFFEGLGLMIKDKNGYLYPFSEQAASVLDVLRIKLRTEGIKVVTGAKVETVQKNGNGFMVRSAGQKYYFDRVILCCGGKAAPKTGSDGSGYKLAEQTGHRIVAVVPALVQLKCRETFFKEIAGVRCDAQVRVLSEPDHRGGEGRISENITERGELQLTDYGISGIPVFQLSRKVNYIMRNRKGDVEVSIDFLPDREEQDLYKMFDTRLAAAADRTVEEFFTGMLNKKLMFLFIKLAGLKREILAKQADERKLKEVLRLCKDFRVHVTGSNSFDNAQVCAGGVDTAQVGTDMQSKPVPGLYFAGEILDVDGRCGGYNLQWAWCSGYIAGKNAARTLENSK